MIFLHQSLIDYENLLNEMKDALDTYESNESGYISQGFIESDVEEGFDKVGSKVKELTGDANGIIESVEDLVTIDKIKHTIVMEDITDGKAKAKNIVDELITLDEFQASELQQTKEDLEDMRGLITDMEAKFKSGELSIADYDGKALQNSAAYNAIIDDIYHKEEAKNDEHYPYAYENKPLYVIEKEKEAAMEYLDSDSQDYLERAYTDLKNGDISRNDFHAILIGEKQKSIAWEGGNKDVGYEVEELWQINYLLNMYKKERIDAERTNDTEKLNEALLEETKLRNAYAHLEEHLIKQSNNLEENGELPHDVPSEDFVLKDGEGFNYRVDNEGHLHYEAEPGYIYDEENYKQTKTNRYHGVAGKGLAITALTRGYSLGAQGTNFAAWVDRGKNLGGGTGAGLLIEYLNDKRIPGIYIPQTDEVKTMIYRENKETGNLEHLTIDSLNSDILEYNEWRDY